MSDNECKEKMVAPFIPGGAFGLDNRVYESLLQDALSSGGDYADLFFEYVTSGSISFEEGITRSASKGVSMGLGVRVCRGDSTGYAHTEDLSAESRELLGWFRYFAQDVHFGNYLLAVDRALAACRARPGRRWREPLLVHFRPTTSLYRWRVSADGTRIILPTPMIVLGDDQFVALAAQMAGFPRSSCVSRSMLTPEYRRVAALLSENGGTADRTSGVAHDLNASFERVNAEYFEGQCERPRLTWSARETLRKFGHYDFVQDLVMLSRTLDAPEVPTFVVDHVMHHELLHKKHGFRWQQGRRHAHLPAFRREERTFRHYREADSFLESLSRSLRCARC